MPDNKRNTEMNEKGNLSMKKNYLTGLLLAAAMTFGACSAGTGTSQTKTEEEKQTITIYAAKSLNAAVDDLIKEYKKDHPNVEITASYDSSGTLMEQIKEGADCDLFFSAAQKQMNTLEEAGLLEEGTRQDVVNNQVCVVTYKGSETPVTGLQDLSKAQSIALADGSVPVGRYTRQALINAGMLETDQDAADVSTEEVSKALGGVEINECANVGAVAAAVSEGSNEVGTVYKSDTTGYEDKLDILEVVSYDLTGNVIYPIAQIKNEQASDQRKAAAKEFLEFVSGDAAKPIFEKYYFDTQIQK